MRYFDIRKEVSDLLAHLKVELDYALPCYEDGTLSPRRSLQHIQEKLQEIHFHVEPIRYNILEERTSSTQPPATPESL